MDGWMDGWMDGYTVPKHQIHHIPIHPYRVRKDPSSQSRLQRRQQVRLGRLPPAPRPPSLHSKPTRSCWAVRQRQRQPRMPTCLRCTKGTTLPHFQMASWICFVPLQSWKSPGTILGPAPLFAGCVSKAEAYNCTSSFYTISSCARPLYMKAIATEPRIARTHRPRLHMPCKSPALALSLRPVPCLAIAQYTSSIFLICWLSICDTPPETYLTSPCSPKPLPRSTSLYPRSTEYPRSTQGYVHLGPPPLLHPTSWSPESTSCYVSYPPPALFLLGLLWSPCLTLSVRFSLDEQT